MKRNRTAVLVSSTMLLLAGWLPLGVKTTVAIGGASVLIGCAGSSERSDTRQDTRTETRTQDRMENRRD